MRLKKNLYSFFYLRPQEGSILRSGNVKFLVILPNLKMGVSLDLSILVSD